MFATTQFMQVKKRSVCDWIKTTRAFAQSSDA